MLRASFVKQCFSFLLCLVLGGLEKEGGGEGSNSGACNKERKETKKLKGGTQTAAPAGLSDAATHTGHAQPRIRPPPAARFPYRQNQPEFAASFSELVFAGCTWASPDKLRRRVALGSAIQPLIY